MSKKSCFVIAPIGEPDSETRRRSDQVLKHVIRAAVEPLGYHVTRADEIAEPGLITSQVIQRIAEDELVIADLSEQNPNVFYELALRHAVRRPLVQLIARGENIPFDVAGMRTIPVDHRDLDRAEEAREEIAKQVRALESATGKVESPISVAIELQSLKQSDDPEQRSLAELLSLVASLRSAVDMIDKKLSMNEKLVERLSDLNLFGRIRDECYGRPVVFFDTEGRIGSTDNSSIEAARLEAYELIKSRQRSRARQDDEKGREAPAKNRESR